MCQFANEKNDSTAHWHIGQLVYYHIVSLAHWLIILLFLKSASNLNGNLNCSKELEHYAS